MTDKIIVETSQTEITVVTIGDQGPQGIQGEPGDIDQTTLDNINNDITSVRTLAETNQLKLTQKVDIQDFEDTQEQVELNRLAILSKADIQALAQLALLVDTKASQSYVQQQIANLVGSAPEALNTIYELAAALQNEQSILESLNQSVANRVRFDVATQALTEIQKQNARINIGAEKLGTAQQLVSEITAQSLGAATAAQGAKADTAIQSADVAPVALSGLFSSLSGQNKIFDVVYGAYQMGSNTALVATDTLGQMLGKLQAQINAGSKVEWVDAETIGTFNTATFGHATIRGKPAKLEFAKINGNLWVRGFLLHKVYDRGQIFTITDKNYKVWSKGSDLAGISVVFAWLSGNSNAIALVSQFDVYDEATAINSPQFLNAPNTMASTTFHIPMQCLGKLVI